jgi:MATE family multidrug resistance protein
VSVLPERERLRRIMGLALPIIGGMMSQNVMNLVDTAMVGDLGAAALGAVGLAGFATFFSQALLLGLSAGVQAMAARRKGEGSLSDMAVPLNGGLVVALTAGIPLSLALILLAPTLFPFLNDDAEVARLGSEFWQIRLVGVTAVAMNFCFRGYFNGIDLSRLYLRTLLVMHAVNITLNYMLIGGNFGAPALGTAGAAIGTTVSLYVGTATYFLLGFRHARAAGFLRGLPDRQTLTRMLRLSIPNGLQQLFFSGGLTALFVIFGKIGTDDLGAANVIVNIMLIGLLPGLALGLASATLVGQCLGKGDVAGARRWGYDVARVSGALLAAIALPFLVVPDLALRVFLHEPHMLELARWPLRIVMTTIFIDGMGNVLMNSLLGAGDTRRVALISIGTQWLFFLPLAWLVGPVLGHGLVGVWLLNALWRGAQALIFWRMWRGTRWSAIDV